MEPLEQVDLAACIAGDTAAWDRFVAAAAPLVVAVARRAARGAPAEVEDFAQEVFVRLVQHDFRLLRAFDSGKARLSTYLMVITRSVVHERLRRKKLPMAASADAAWIADHAPVVAAERRETSEQIRELPFEALPEQQRSVLLLMHRQGLSVPEVARRLGVTEQTVRSAHHKAVSRLRELLGVDPGSRKRGGLHGAGDAGTT